MQPWINVMQRTWYGQVGGQDAPQYFAFELGLPWQDSSLVRAQAQLWEQLWRMVEANLTLWGAWWPGARGFGSFGGFGRFGGAPMPSLCGVESPAAAQARRDRAALAEDAAGASPSLAAPGASADVPARRVPARAPVRARRATKAKAPAASSAAKAGQSRRSR